MGKILIVSKDIEEWLEEQRVITQNLRDDAVGNIKYYAGGRLEFIEQIQSYIKEGLIKVKEFKNET